MLEYITHKIRSCQENFKKNTCNIAKSYQLYNFIDPWKEWATNTIIEWNLLSNHLKNFRLSRNYTDDILRHCVLNIYKLDVSNSKTIIFS